MDSKNKSKALIIAGFLLLLSSIPKTCYAQSVWSPFWNSFLLGTWSVVLINLDNATVEGDMWAFDAVDDECYCALGDSKKLGNIHGRWIAACLYYVTSLTGSYYTSKSFYLFFNGLSFIGIGPSFDMAIGIKSAFR